MQTLIDAAAANALNGEVALVVASKPGAYALERARIHAIPAFCLTKKDYPLPGTYDDKVITLIKEYDIDLIVLAGFTVVMGKAFVDAFPGRIVNIHPAIRPQFGGKGFYGLRVHQAVLDAGETETGAMVHYVTVAVDGGPVIASRTVAVHKDDTPESLQKRVMEEAERLVLPEAVNIALAELGACE